MDPNLIFEFRRNIKVNEEVLEQESFLISIKDAKNEDLRSNRFVGFY
ncbi:hypothetical protein LEP1GSC008_0506 [Leptospira kirschneri serovar Bulgarica str. Nikolaevo]|uniref:Uncharacterized protein n=1 Tax=Leptospira kirschneri serovar Bulgarica str. Nikolaevo TaxID=1240687 RepID=M6F9I5_9LEPT|nr:hypothetical protein LEP1GSC008_0506 [Leptospira kirschneri serovar Bulgarica str. Nikolaevo]